MKRTYTKASRAERPEKFDRPIPGHPDYTAHIVKTTYKDGACLLRGVLHNTSGQAIPGAGYREALARRPADVNSALLSLVSRIARDVPTRVKPIKRAQNPRQTLDGKYADAFAVVKADSSLFTTWGTATRKSAMMWAERHFIPFLEADFSSPNTAVIGGPNLAAWKNRELSKISDHGRCRSALTANKTMARHCRECLEIYLQMRKVDSSLPSIMESEMYDGVIKIEVEQFKAIPEPCRQRMYRALEEKAILEPEMTFATTIMVCGNVRTSEAAAVLPSDVSYLGEYAAIPIIYQESNGVRSAILKTKNAYRVVPIPLWGVTVLRDCAAHMTNPPPANSDKALVTSMELSSWILQLLKDCGVDQALIQAAEKASALFPDKTNDQLISRDVAAYILRRDGASRMQDYMGIGQDLLDPGLGHKRT